MISLLIQACAGVHFVARLKRTNKKNIPLPQWPDRDIAFSNDAVVAQVQRAGDSTHILSTCALLVARQRWLEASPRSPTTRRLPRFLGSCIGSVFTVFAFLLAGTVMGESGNQNGLLWQTVGSEITIYGNDGSLSGAVSIPNSITFVRVVDEIPTPFTFPVTSIGVAALQQCASLTSVTIPASVTSIGSSAFYNCVNLASVTIPGSVTSIGAQAFRECSSLVSITIPNSVTSGIGGWTFYGCSALTTVTIGNSVAGIGIGAFQECASLPSVTIPDSVANIGDSAFYDCANLGSVTIPDSVTSIGTDAFGWCQKMTSVTIGNSVASIGDRAFYQCSSLSSIVIPDSVTSGIGEETFSGCTDLSSITIGSSVASIGDSAFYDCANLGSVTIPDSVTSIGTDAFGWCQKMTSVTIGNSVASIGDSAFYYCINLTSIAIPDGVTSIGDNAFASCYGLAVATIGNGVATIGVGAFHSCLSLTDVMIGNSVTSIGDEAFEDCVHLPGVVIPDSVSTIGDRAFYNCISMGNATIGSGVQSIGTYAFYQCALLTSVTIPSSVTIMGDAPFGGCVSLQAIDVNSQNAFFSSDNGVLLDKNKTKLIQYPAGLGDAYKVLDGVTDIGSGAFAFCQKLNSVTIPASVTAIGSYAFEACDKLITVCFEGEEPSAAGYVFYDSGVRYVSHLTNYNWGPIYSGLPTVACEECVGTNFAIRSISGMNFSGVRGDGRHAYFLSGVPAAQSVRVTVNWGTKQPKIIHYLCPERFDDLEDEHDFNIGDWPVGAQLQVIAEADDGTLSEPVTANFDVIPPPPGMPAGLLQWVPIAGSVGTTFASKYSFAGVNWDLFDASGTPPDTIPIWGGKTLEFLADFNFSADVQDDGTAEGGITVGLGSGYDKTWKTTGTSPGTKVSMAGLTVNPEVTVNPKWNWDGAQWRMSGSFGLNLNSSLSIPPPGAPAPYIWLEPPIYVRGTVDANVGGTCDIEGFGPNGLPQLNGVLSADAQPTFIAGCGWAHVLNIEVGVGGGPKMELQWPNQPTLRKLGLHTEGSITATLYLYQTTIAQIEDDWWMVGAAGMRPSPLSASPSGNMRVLMNSPQSGRYSLMPRNYISSAIPYAVFATSPQNELTSVSPSNPEPADGSLSVMESNVYPYSEPCLADSGTNRMMAWVWDNPGRASVNRTELRWSKWTGSTWSNPTSVWNEGTADFTPSLHVFPNGTALATWQNEKSALTNGAMLSDALAGLEIGVALFNPNNSTWQAANLTTNSYIDRSPQISGASNGKTLLTWVSNTSNDTYGTASAPNTINSRLWTGTNWLNSGAISTNARMLLWSSVSFNGTAGVYVAAMDGDDDQLTSQDQEIYGATFNGSAWSAFVQVTTNTIQDTKPQVAYDNLGNLLVVWSQGSNLVMRTGDLNLSSTVEIGNVGGSTSSKDFRLVTGPAGQISLIWEDAAPDGTGPDPFMLNYDPLLHVWSQPIRILNNSSLLERSFAAAYSASGNLMMAYNQVHVQIATNGVPVFSNAVVDLMFLDYQMGYDVALNAADITLSTNTPMPGDTIDISAVIHNAGELAVTNVEVAFYYGDPAGGGTLIDSIQIIPLLAAGASTNVHVSWEVPWDGADNAIYVVIDPDLVQPDGNLANNAAFITAFAPDLLCSGMSVFNSATNRRLVYATVRNDGNLGCTNSFNVEFHRGAANGPLLASIPVNPLFAGGQENAIFEWNLNGVTFTSAMETIYAIIDPENIASELNEANNACFVQSQTMLYQQPISGYALWAGAITNGLTNYNESATGDGDPNLIKYATGSSATNSDDLASVRGVWSTNGGFRFMFNRNQQAYDVTMVVEGGYSLSNGATWRGIATNIGGTWGMDTKVTESGTSTPVTVTIRDAMQATNRFMRLRVTRP